MDKRAIKLREDLRALAATILQIVQYEITEAKVVEVLKENRRLVTLLEIEIDAGRFCSDYPKCLECRAALWELAQDEARAGYVQYLFNGADLSGSTTVSGYSACKYLEKLKEEKRVNLEAKVKEEFSKAMTERMGEELDEYINQRVTYLNPLTITKEEDKKLIEQLDERAKERAKTRFVVIPPAHQAMGDIVKDHLMPPAPFIDRGKAE